MATLCQQLAADFLQELGPRGLLQDPLFLLRLSRFLTCGSCFVAHWFLLHQSPDP